MLNPGLHRHNPHTVGAISVAWFVQSRNVTKFPIDTAFRYTVGLVRYCRDTNSEEVPPSFPIATFAHHSRHQAVQTARSSDGTRLTLRLAFTGTLR